MIIDIRIRRQTITEILFRSGSLIHDVLEDFKGALGHDDMSNDTPRHAIDGRHHVNFVFF